MSDSGFVSHCLELLAPLGRTSSRRMFGGHALYIDGLCMALIIRDVLYLKVDDAHRPLFERAGGLPFTYAGKNDETHSLSYYTVPEEAMESPAEMMPWARRGLAAAVAARAKAPIRKTAKKTPARPARGTPGITPTRKAKTAAAKPAPRRTARS
jgi:DNA transformation protein